VLSGSAAIINSTSNITGVSGLSNGLNVFQWSISNGICPASVATVSVYKNDPPTTALVGSSITVCSTSIILNGNLPAVGSGTWTAINSTASIANPLSNTTAVTGLNTGTNVFQWSIGNAPCPVSTATLLIIRDDFPTISIAGINQTVCSAVTTLSANMPLTGVGSWSVLSGSAIPGNLSANTTSVTNLSIGSNLFQWSIINGVCPPSISTVIVQRDDLPTLANAGLNQVICSSTATLNGNVPISGTGSWSVVTGTASITNTLLSNTSVSSLSTGTNIFEWRIVNGVCPPSTSTVLINRDAMPSVANAGVSQTLCATSGSLNAIIPSMGTGSWSVLSGSATISNPTSNIASVIGLAVGNNIFEWSVVNGVCPASTATVGISRDDFPSSALVASNQTVCGNSGTISANAPLIGIGSWSLISGTGSVQTAGTPTTAVTISAGLNLFVWKITNGVCQPETDTICILGINPPSQPFAGQDQAVCNATATLQASLPSSGNGSWQLISGQGTISNNTLNTTPVTSLNEGANKFVWTISKPFCPSLSDTVSIVRDLEPSAANAGNDLSVCGKSVTVSANNPLKGTGKWSVITGSAVAADLTKNIAELNQLSEGKVTLVWKITNGVCPASLDSVSILVYHPLTGISAGPDLITCSPTVFLSATIPSKGFGNWTAISDSIKIADKSSAVSQVTDISPGSHL
jgi:hypothetical protein